MPSDNYGSIEESENAPLNRTFDADHAYYLKDGSRAPLTFKQRLRKYSLIAVPLLAAVLIIGGAAFFLLRNFNHLYPGSSGGYGEETRAKEKAKHDYSTGVTAPATSPAGPTASASSVSTGSGKGTAACASNPKCAEAGLLGQCCPTAAGVMLECCKN